MALFQAIGVGAKIVKGLWKGARAKRKAKRAKRKAAKAAKLASQSEAQLAAAGYGMTQKMLQGVPQIQENLSDVQQAVFGGAPSMNAEDADPTTSFTSTGGGGRLEELSWYQKVPMWVWIAGGSVTGIIFIVLIVRMFKRK